MRVTRLHLLLLAFSVCLGCKSTAAVHGDGPPPTSDASAACALAACENAFARTCDPQPLTLDCTTFDASCASFVVEHGAPFSWCGCGPIAEGQGRCLDGRNGVTCDQGQGLVAQCLPGTRCMTDPTSQYGLTCDCDNVADGVCPDPACTADPDCAQCTPSSADKVCGDNGCGGECGACAFGQTCTDSGQCDTICVPACTGKQCGSDGCGGTCGSCDGTCTSDGQCMGTCVPSCAGKACGSDGCSGMCGSCTGGLSCNSGACGCDFFARLTYTFTLDPAAMWPTGMIVGLNVQHINLDGSETYQNSNGALLGFGANAMSTFSFVVEGCQPDIRIKRDYGLAGVTCQATDTITGRTSFTIEPPTMSNGTCSATAL